jgi:hypothetical protein
VENLLFFFDQPKKRGHVAVLQNVERLYTGTIHVQKRALALISLGQFVFLTICPWYLWDVLFFSMRLFVSGMQLSLQKHLEVIYSKMRILLSMIETAPSLFCVVNGHAAVHPRINSLRSVLY